MKKNFMFGIFVFSMMTFSINIHATELTGSGMDGNINGLEVSNTSLGTEISLTQNVDLGSNYLNIISGSHVIDLNGYSLLGNNEIVVYINGDNASLTINDTSSLKTGKIICTKENNNTYQAATHLKNGSLTINGGIFESEDYGVYFQDNGTINAGTFGKDNSQIGAVFTKSATINNGVFKGSVGLYNVGKTSEDVLIIKNGVFGNEHSLKGIYLQGGKVIIEDALVNSSSENGYGIQGTITNDAIIDLTINKVGISGGNIGLALNSIAENGNNSIRIKGGTYSGKEVGFMVGEKLIGNTKISGGVFKSTNLNQDDNYGGIMMILEQSISGDILSNPSFLDTSYESVYTLNSLLESGYNYSNRTFNEKTYTDTSEDIVSTITISGTANDVFVAQEKAINIKSGIVNGTVTAQQMAVVGEEVTLTVNPANGYKLKSISVLDRFDEMQVDVTNDKFIMPNYNVYIGAEFEIDYSFYQESSGQTYKIKKDDKLEFKLKPEYSLFENGGKVYVDDELVEQNYITSRSGSTIITLSKEYLNNLSLGSHTLKVTFNTNISVETTFSISREELNPQTSDGILISIIIGCMSLIGLFCSSIYFKKRFN